MVSSEKAAELAKQLIENYLNQCQLATNEDAAVVLMNLVAASGVVMVATVGFDEGMARLFATVDLVERKTAYVKFTQQTVN